MAIRRWSPAGLNGIPQATKNLTRSSQSFVGINTTSTVAGRTAVIKAVCNAPIPKNIPVTFYQGATSVLGTANFQGLTATLYTTLLGTGTNTTVRAEWPGEGRYEGFVTYTTQTVTVIPGEIIGASFFLTNLTSRAVIDEPVTLTLSANTTTNLNGTGATFYARKSNGLIATGPLRTIGQATFVGNTATLVTSLEGPLLPEGVTFDYLTAQWDGGNINNVQYQGKAAGNQPVVAQLYADNPLTGATVTVTASSSTISTLQTATFTISLNTTTNVGTSTFTLYKGTATLTTATAVNKQAIVSFPPGSFTSGNNTVYAVWNGTTTTPKYAAITGTNYTFNYRTPGVTQTTLSLNTSNYLTTATLGPMEGLITVTGGGASYPMSGTVRLLDDENIVLGTGTLLTGGQNVDPYYSDRQAGTNFQSFGYLNTGKFRKCWGTTTATSNANILPGNYSWTEAGVFNNVTGQIDPTPAPVISTSSNYTIEFWLNSKPTHWGYGFGNPWGVQPQLPNNEYSRLLYVNGYSIIHFLNFRDWLPSEETERLATASLGLNGGYPLPRKPIPTLQIRNGTSFSNSIASETLITSTNVLSYNNWNHIAIQNNGGTAGIYVNGQLQISFNDSRTLGGQMILYGPGDWSLDELAIYDIPKYTGNFITPGWEVQDNITYTTEGQVIISWYPTISQQSLGNRTIRAEFIGDLWNASSTSTGQALLLRNS